MNCDPLAPTPVFPPDHPSKTPERWAARLERIPPRFRRHDRALFPDKAFAELLEAIPAAIELDPEIAGAGWVLAGGVGVAKTRTACLLALHRVAVTWGWPGYLSAVQMRAKAFSDWGAAEKIIEEACKPEILVFDDLGKGTPGATIDELVCAILDYRTNHLKPTIITTQYDPDGLRARFKESATADAIMRRIEQFSTPILL